MKCPSCGFENEADVKFCGNCGVKLPEKADGLGKKLFCPNCGQENPPGSRFCQSCGSEIIRPGARAQSVPPPPLQAVPASVPVAAPAPLRKKTTGWVWMLAGIAVVLIAATVFYFLSSRPAAPTANEAEAAGGDPVPSQAPGTCRPDEKMLYTEDFEDGTAQYWPGVSQDPHFFSIGPALDDAENLVLTIQKPAGTSDQAQAGPQLMVTPFSNAVLRLRFYVSGPLPVGDNDWFSFNWLFANQPFTLEGQQVYDSRYQLSVGFNYFEMRRLQQPVTNVSVDRSVHPRSGEWHSLEIATYQPRTEVWLDGKQVMEYEDPSPLPAGTFGLEAWLLDPQVKLLFDDISICELAAPYQP